MKTVTGTNCPRHSQEAATRQVLPSRKACRKPPLPLQRGIPEGRGFPARTYDANLHTREVLQVRLVRIAC